MIRRQIGANGRNDEKKYDKIQDVEGNRATVEKRCGLKKRSEARTRE